MPRANDGVIFSIIFKKGRADQNRLPLYHVISTLQQVDQMIREVGKQIQRAAGVENPDGDFGIELLAGTTGIAFRKGSLGTSSAITKNINHGIEAVSRVIETTDIIEREKPAPATLQYNEHVLRRLPTISAMQELDKTELHLELVKDSKLLKRARFGEHGREALRSMESAELTVEAVTIYGKLRLLRDLTRVETRESAVWGELIEDNGNRWRLKFRDSDLGNALKLFTRQVSVSGDATYYKTKFPRVDVKDIKEESAPDYLAAFDHFRHEYEGIFEDRDLDDILNDIRE